MTIALNLSGTAELLAIDVYYNWIEPQHVNSHLDHDGHRWMPGELAYITRHFDAGKWSRDEEIIAARQELIEAGLIVFQRIGNHWYIRPTPTLVERHANDLDDV